MMNKENCPCLTCGGNCDCIATCDDDCNVLRSGCEWYWNNNESGGIINE